MRATIPLLLLCFSLQASEPLQALAPSVRLPQLAASQPLPRLVSKLNTSQLYVIEADVDVLVLPSPLGIVRKTEDTGPLKIKGIFADGNGEYETRTYKGKQVITIEAASTGTVELLIVPVGGKEADVIRRTLDVDAGKVNPKPKPDPKPDPYVGKGRILVVEETEQAADNRGQYFSNEALMGYIKSKCSNRPRIVDQNVKDASGNPPADIAPWLAMAKGKTLPQIFVVAVDGTILFSGDLPKTPELLMAKLKEVFGE